MAGRSMPLLMAAKVTSVDGDTCTVDIDGMAVEDVRLRAVADGGADGVLMVPTVGSYVVVADLGEANLSVPVVVAWSAVERVEFRGGENGGLVNIGPMVDKLNALEDEVNGLKQAIASWAPVPNDGGAALKTALATWADGQLAKTQAGDLEDENFKH